MDPVYLNGRKWKHVIVTIPRVEEAPQPPLRRKRKFRSPPSAATDCAAVEIQRDRLIFGGGLTTRRWKSCEIFSSAQLDAYLRILKIGLFGTDSGGDQRLSRIVDLRFTLLRERRLSRLEINPSTWTNEAPAAEAADFVLLAAPCEHVVFSKFAKIRQPLRLRSAGRVDTAEITQTRRRRGRSRALVPSRGVGEKRASDDGRSPSSFRGGSSATMTGVKNVVVVAAAAAVALKTNQKWNGVVGCLRKKNIEKLWRKIKKSFGADLGLTERGRRDVTQKRLLIESYIERRCRNTNDRLPTGADTSNERNLAYDVVGRRTSTTDEMSFDDVQAEMAESVLCGLYSTMSRGFDEDSDSLNEFSCSL